MIDPPSSSTVKIIAGSPLSLSCTSRGSPPDTFTWMKDGTPAPLTPTLTTITHNSTDAIFRSDYNIINTTTGDIGTYTCTVTNPIGSDSFTISVMIDGETLCYLLLVQLTAGTELHDSQYCYNFSTVFLLYTDQYLKSNRLKDYQPKYCLTIRTIN